MSVASTLALADNIIIEGSTAEGLYGKPDAQGMFMAYGHKFNNNLNGDFQYVTSQSQGTNTMNTRLDFGAIPNVDLGPVTAYSRLAVGRKYNSSPTLGNFDYYSVEPGIIVPLGAGFKAKIGWRYRTAFDDKNLDQTRTWRIGGSYAITEQDAIGLRFDRIRGDLNQNLLAFSYIRSF